ncbi:hypothetical protein DFA_12212 [Cavenderia fasciculata]|uniref:Uncharacterized protein n=1 Tax=Cavenderia fasciculata TaxID=261658 RepID=F4QCL2_CACFS|nr:uncharacterized protein DFA_12212 [Cavenderia fasciculata]EGG14440.1 hypothetical protein DFA_12212 [Cavenderia fasciculata]|eukprot:XP_004353849.1 hypothetical protein DFA_12212 [Cavenderia fasciculata]
MGGINSKTISNSIIAKQVIRNYHHNNSVTKNENISVGGKDLLSVFLFDCDNAPHYSNKDVKSYMNKKLKAKISYGNNDESILQAPFIKRPSWEKGYVQFPFNELEKNIRIDIESCDGDRIGSATIPLDQYQPNQLHSIKLDTTNSKFKDDTTVSLLFSKDDLDELDIVKSTSKGKSKSIVFQDAIDSLDNGDVIFYDGGESLISKWIKKRTCRPYSHCGLVVKTFPQRQKGEPAPTEKELFVIESVLGYDGKDPFREYDVLAGVNIYPLKKRLLDYEGPSIWSLKQKVPFTEDQKEAFMMSVWEYHGRRVSFDVLNSSFIAMGFNNLIFEGKRAFFCSELVAQILFNANALTSEEANQKASAIDPGQLSEFDCFGGQHPRLLRHEINSHPTKIELSHQHKK